MTQKTSKSINKRNKTIQNYYNHDKRTNKNGDNNETEQALIKIQNVMQYKIAEWLKSLYSIEQQKCYKKIKYAMR